jgi:tRNA(fMet)-specific endonuclease VapC
VITFEEQARGRLNSVHAATTSAKRVMAYSLLRQLCLNYLKVRMLEFDEAAEWRADQLRKGRVRIGTHDLRIAAICISQDALLLSRNLIDFRKVPGLRVEDWTQS